MSEPAVLTAIAPPRVSSEELELVKQTVAAGATDAELKLYLFDCQRQQVHPLDKLIWFTKRSGKYTPITSIDFMRIRAASTGECIGIDHPVFTGTPKQADFTATVTVYRLVQGQRSAFSATAYWSEYKPETHDFMWQRMPHTMLGKCAEALALRRGFPQQLSGLYAKEELDQADTSETPTPIDVGAPRTISQAQYRRLCALTDKSWTKTAKHNYLFKTYGLHRGRDILTSDYDAICATWAHPLQHAEDVPAESVPAEEQPF